MSWRLAKSLAQLAREVDSIWPGTTIWSIGDQDHASRSSDHNPNPQGVVCAIDVLGGKQSDALWAFLKEARDPRMKYDIHDQKILSSTVSPWQVRRYTGSNPHTHHIHISVGRGPDGHSTRPDLYDDPSPWGLTGVKAAGTDIREADMAVADWAKTAWEWGKKVGLVTSDSRPGDTVTKQELVVMLDRYHRNVDKTGGSEGPHTHEATVTLR